MGLFGSPTGILAIVHVLGSSLISAFRPIFWIWDASKSKQAETGLPARRRVRLPDVPAHHGKSE